MEFLKYIQVCETIRYNVDENFVYPSLLPQAALYGWKNSCSMKIWPKTGENKKIADELINFLKYKKIISSTKLKELKLVYKAVTETTHVAELIFEFEAEHEMFDEQDQE